MEDPSSPTLSDENWTDDFARKLSEQRTRVEEFLAAQRERLDRARTRITEDAHRISEELGQNRLETAHTRHLLQCPYSNKYCSSFTRQRALV